MPNAETLALPIVLNLPVNLVAVIQPEPETGGFSASIPALNGCHTQGKTLDEVRANLRQAAEAWLAAAHENGIGQRAVQAIK